MAKKNNRSENGNDAFENVDPLQPKLENLDPEFNFPVMLSEFENRAGDDDKKKAAILARVKVNEGHIRRISNLIDQLKFKLVAESGGRAESYREEDGARIMAPTEIVVRVALGRGNAKRTMYSCDFSYEYVKINADYRS